MGTMSKQEQHPFEAWFSVVSPTLLSLLLYFVVCLLSPTADMQQYDIGWQTTLQMHKIKWLRPLVWFILLGASMLA